MSDASRVLLVDDNALVRSTIKRILRRYSCEFFDAPTAQAALDLLQRLRFDVTFLDLMLPGIPGLEFFRLAVEKQKGLGKVIVVTGNPDAQSQEEALALGAIAYLDKSPLDTDKVMAAFDQATGVAAAAIRVEPEQVAMNPLAAARRRSRLPKRHRPRSLSIAGRPRVLVVDDQPRWHRAIDLLLGERFDLVVTRSVEQASRRAGREEFVLAVIDMRLLNGATGLEVLARIRRSSPELPAMILTAYPDHWNALQSGNLGAVDYLSKGEIAKLPERVDRILSEPGRAPRVFLAYAGADRARVRELYLSLLEHGLLPWMDVMNLVAGSEWEPAILDAINSADYFVYCVSSSSQIPTDVLKKELNRALERQRSFPPDTSFIVAARLDEVDVPGMVAGLQYVNLFRPEGLSKLLAAISARQRVTKA